MWKKAILRQNEGQGLFSSDWCKYKYPEWFSVDVKTDYRENPMSYIAPTNAFLHAEFHPDNYYSHMVALASEEAVFISDCRKQYTVAKSYGATLPLDIKWVPGGGSVMFPSTQSSLCQWHLEADTVLDLGLEHGATIRSLAFLNSNMFASSCRAGSIRVFDLRMKRGKTVSCIVDAHSTHSKPLGSASSKAVACVLYQSEHRLISCGSTDGKIKVWDSRKHYSSSYSSPQPLHTYEYCGPGKRPYGFTHMCQDTTGSRLFAYCMDQSVYSYNIVNHAAHNTLPEYVYDMRCDDSELSCDFTGKMYTKLSVSPDDRYLLTGSCAGAAFILQVDRVGVCPVKLPCSVLSNHQEGQGDVEQAAGQENMCCCAVAWNRHRMDVVITGDDDGGVRVWRSRGRGSQQTASAAATGDAARVIHAYRTPHYNIYEKNKFMSNLKLIKQKQRDAETKGKVLSGGQSLLQYQPLSYHARSPVTRLQLQQKCRVASVGTMPTAAAVAPTTSISPVAEKPLPQHSASAAAGGGGGDAKAHTALCHNMLAVDQLPSAEYSLHPTLHTYCPSTIPSHTTAATTTSPYHRASAAATALRASPRSAKKHTPLKDKSAQVLNIQRKRSWWESAGFKRSSSSPTASEPNNVRVSSQSGKN